jgi:hypothetical protein
MSDKLIALLIHREEITRNPSQATVARFHNASEAAPSGTVKQFAVNHMNLVASRKDHRQPIGSMEARVQNKVSCGEVI